MPHPEQPTWTPGPFAIEHDVAVDPDDRVPVSVVVRHPAAPFVRYLEVGAETETALQALALEYLVQLGEKAPTLRDPGRDGVFQKWLKALARSADPDPRFGWLPLAPSGAEFGHPMKSYWFERSDDRTVVLLASERFGPRSAPEEFLASGFGLRVIGHMRRTKPPAPYLELRISGFSASLPFGGYRTSGVIDLDPTHLSMKDIGARMAAQAGAISDALDLYEPVFTRLRLQGGPGRTLRFEANGTSFDYGQLRPRGSDHRVRGALPHAFYVRGTVSAEGKITDLSSLARIPLVAYATRSFLHDPASEGAPADARKRRPTRDDATLTKHLTDAPTLPSGPFSVGTGKLVRPPRPNTQPPRPAASPIRADAFGEVGARVNLGRFFARLRRYGISENTYFRVGRPEIEAVCRSGIHPGPGKDGNTVNARVTLGHWGKSFYDGNTGVGDRPVITMHFALADLSTRSRNCRDNDDWVAAEPLGITADPRWFWHEIGHVLLAASVGELEFRFAHSAGDALAAIASDPQSHLADSPARGATFPWVFVPRRHDRCASHGWSWSGAMHRPPGLRAYPERIQLKGYWSEQILSSSLFRLYRCLGGDATLIGGSAGRQPDRLAREAAADYAIYLVIKAIGLLGYAGAVPAHRPDHFVSALIDADIGTGTFSTKVPEGSTPSRTVTRVGGCAHKVIRWAFETQGLYVPAGEFRSGPGDPPPVDVYIADGRPSEETIGFATTRYGSGSYAPVPLGWTPGQGPAPAWHAAPAAITVEAGGVFVTVGNRGSETAKNVEVKLWAHECPGPDAPEWHPATATGAWTECPAPTAAPQDIPRTADDQQAVRFGPFQIPASVTRPCVLLAVSTCVDDRANTDTATQLPCSRQPVPLADLVAGDNNLGLRYLP